MLFSRRIKLLVGDCVFGCILSFLDSESVFRLARWLDLLFVCMKIKTCACTRWLFWVTRYEILQEISYSPDILIGDRSTLDKESRAANKFDPG